MNQKGIKMDKQPFKNPQPLTKELRANITGIGKLIGKRIFCLVSDNIDLEYAKKAHEDKTQALPIKPYKKLFIEAIDIVAIAPRTIDGKIYIQLNDDPKLQYAISGDVEKVTQEFSNEIFDLAVKKAMTNDPRPIFFADCERITDEVTARNAIEIAKIEAFIQDLYNQIDCLKAINENAVADKIDYYTQLGIVH